MSQLPLSARPPSPGIVGAILAGGQSLRMGRDKSQVLWRDRPLIDWVSARLGPQVDHLLISLPYDQPTPNDHRQMVRDHQPNLGPLGGVVAALQWLQIHRPHANLLTCSCDAPLIPSDLATRLVAASVGGELVYARSGSIDHYTHSLWATSLIAPIQDYLNVGGRSLRGFIASQRSLAVEFPSTNGLDPFTNINSPTELQSLNDLCP